MVLEDPENEQITSDVGADSRHEVLFACVVHD